MNKATELKVAIEANQLLVIERFWGNGLLHTLSHLGMDGAIKWRASQIIDGDIEYIFNIIKSSSAPMVIFDEVDRALPETQKIILSNVKKIDKKVLILGYENMGRFAEMLSCPLIKWEVLNWRST